MAYAEVMRLRAAPDANEVHTEWLGWLSGYWLEMEQRQAESDPDAEHEHRYEPEVYVTDLDSLERRVYHSHWIDADQPPAAIEADIAAMLERSPTAGASRWAVSTQRDFAGYDMSGLADATVISKVARGILEHGAAYAAWVAVAGTDSPDRLDQFADFYVASYPTLEAWVREVAAELEWDKHLDQVLDPELRKYVAIDYRRFAEDAVERWDVMHGHDNRIHVFLR